MLTILLNGNPDGWKITQNSGRKFLKRLDPNGSLKNDLHITA